LKDLEQGEKGRVAEIVDGDTLVLDSGLRVTLTGMEAPYGARPFAADARQALERFTLHREVRLAYGGTRRLATRGKANDVPGPAAPASPTPASTTATSAPAKANPAPASGETALAQVFVRSEGGRWIWVQQAMVSQGFARVRTRRENRARAAELLAAEAQARAASRGLWALRDYRVLTAAAAAAEAERLPTRCTDGPFLIVEGRVRQVTADNDRVYLNFGDPDDYRTDFTVGVYGGESVSAWRTSGPAFESYQNKRVRVRGRAANRGGPLICADHPEQIEVLDAT
jgi:endonuclease YncB( thermonuclease family)